MWEPALCSLEEPGKAEGWEGESCLEENTRLCVVGSPGFLQVSLLFLYRLGLPRDSCWAASCLDHGIWCSMDLKGRSMDVIWRCFDSHSDWGGELISGDEMVSEVSYATTLGQVMDLNIPFFCFLLCAGPHLQNRGMVCICLLKSFRSNMSNGWDFGRGIFADFPVDLQNALCSWSNSV